MDILKLNKWKVIIISFFLAIFFINRECKKNEEELLIKTATMIRLLYLLITELLVFLFLLRGDIRKKSWKV